MTPGGIATLACLLEVSAPKPGNVHRGADFEDTTLNDFLASAVALGQVVDAHATDEFCKTVLKAVEATRHVAGTNTNLGMILLLVPLAKLSQREEPLAPSSIKSLIASTTASDTDFIYRAIRLAQPGGLGTVDQMDVNCPEDEPLDCLAEAMKLAADRDMIARQFVNGFEQVFNDVVPTLVRSQTTFPKLSEAIVLTHLTMIARFGDSLIERKCGKLVSDEARSRAQQTVDQLPKTGDDLAYEQFWAAVSDFDFWLRSDGHRRNPGTTADLLAAGIYVGLDSGEISSPFR
jgi:triphosphoribosyl-dephospho-CoA synthase